MNTAEVVNLIRNRLKEDRCEGLSADVKNAIVELCHACCHMALCSHKNEWKEAVLDELAEHALDAPVTTSPREIVAILLETNSKMATDPAINAEPPDTAALRAELERVKGERDAMKRKIAARDATMVGKSLVCNRCGKWQEFCQCTQHPIAAQGEQDAK